MKSSLTISYGPKQRERLYIFYTIHRQKNLIPRRRQVKSGYWETFPSGEELIDSFKSGKFIGGIVVQSLSESFFEHFSPNSLGTEF